MGINLNLSGFNRGHWYDWQRTFISVELSKDNTLQTSIRPLNIFLRIFRVLFGWYETTHRSTIQKMCFQQLNPEDREILERICRIAKVSYTISLSKHNDLNQRLRTERTAALISTTYHSEKDRKSAQDEYVCDSCSVTERGLSTAVVVCDGYGHSEGARLAANKAVYAVRRAVLVSEPLTFDSTSDKVEKHFQKVREIAKNNPDAANMGSVGNTSLLCYEVLRNDPGKKRVVGINGGDGALLSYSPKTKKVGVISFPQKFLTKESGTFQYSYCPSLFFSVSNMIHPKELEEAFQKSKIQLTQSFDRELAEEDLIIGATDGLLNGIEEPRELVEGRLKLLEMANCFDPRTKMSQSKKDALSKEMFQKKLHSLADVCEALRKLESALTEYRTLVLEKLLSNLEEDRKRFLESDQKESQQERFRNNLFGVIDQSPPVKRRREVQQEKTLAQKVANQRLNPLLEPYRKRLADLQGNVAIFSCLPPAESWEKAWEQVRDAQLKQQLSSQEECMKILQECFEQVLQPRYMAIQKAQQLEAEEREILLELDDTTIIVTK